MANDHRNIKELKKMTGNEYQFLARRTIQKMLETGNRKRKICMVE